jgi:hypothetical protein
MSINRTGACKSFAISYPILTPFINNLSSYYSVVGATTLVTIFGNNFRDFSVVKFAASSISSIFISSTQISFYIPNTYSYGTYSIQVFNDIYGSNVVDFTIDNNGSYWILTPGTNSINNINTGDINMYCSVFANYLNSYSIPGAYLTTSNNVIYPIYSSITDYTNFFSNSNASSTNSSTTPGLCYISTSNNTISVTIDYYYIVSPGYQIIVKNSSSTETLKVSNLSYKPVIATPSDFTGTSCSLYFWSNSTWNLI